MSTDMVNTATGELVQLTPSAPMTVDEILQQRNVITQVLHKVMIPDVHYGKIPGTGAGMSLLKPGADMLLSTFHIATDPEIEDLSGHQEIRYRVKLRGLTIGSGQLVGVGIGEASSNEEKYRWKKANNNEWNNTPETMRRIKYTEWNNQPGETKQVRANPYDVVNTVLKMAKKRASVDLVLTALAAAEVFDRIEDVLKTEDARTRQQPQGQATGTGGIHESQQAASPPTQTTQGPDQAGDHGAAIHQLRQKADHAGLRDVDVFAQFTITDWAGIKPDMVAKVEAWIQGMMP